MHPDMSCRGNRKGGGTVKESYNILIVGIGGQGTILASNILGEACIHEGRSVKGAETHGMAQRGGSVESHIRIDGNFGPLIPPGLTDLVIAFDMLEGLRYSHLLKSGGWMILNTQLVIPTSVYMQDAKVPSKEEIRSRLSGINLCLIDADRIALEAGSPLSVNIVMLGAASHHMPLAVNSLENAVDRLVPPKTVGINRSAFEMGREAGKDCLKGKRGAC